VVGYTPAKFHLSILIGSWVICVCAKKTKMAAAAILNYYFVTLDHPRSPFADLKLLFKDYVDLVHFTFRDIAIKIFRKFGLKWLFRTPKSCFGKVNLSALLFIIEIPKRHFLVQKRVLRPHMVVIGLTVWPGREAKSTKKKETLSGKPKFVIFADSLLVVPRQPHFAC